MAEMIFTQDYSGFDSEVIVTERNDPVYGPVTIFHDVVIAREIVHPFKVGNKMLMAYKSADELEQYWPWVEGRWAIAGRHPDTPVIVKPGDIQGRTVNSRFVKNLIDHDKTGRNNIRGILVDLEVFNDRVAPDTLKGMIDGTLPAVSIGYLHAQEMTSGKWNGQDYDFKQTNMFHDHTAFGIKKGRCPFPACGVGADSLLEAKCLNDGCSNRQLKNMAIVGRDPEETEESIRIPNPGGSECEVTATITISEDQGITATYCGDSETIQTYIFDKAKDWTLESAQTWVDEHQEGAGADMLNTIVKMDIKLKAYDQEEGAPDADRAKAHYGLTDEVWDSLSDSAKAALIAALPEEPVVGADMSEEEIKEKIMEIQKQIDDLFTPVPEAETEKYAEYEVLYAELNGYKEALTELIKAKAVAVPAVDEVERSKRLLSDPRLLDEPYPK